MVLCSIKSKKAAEPSSLLVYMIVFFVGITCFVIMFISVSFNNGGTEEAFVYEYHDMFHPVFVQSYLNFEIEREGQKVSILQLLASGSRDDLELANRSKVLFYEAYGISREEGQDPIDYYFSRAGPRATTFNFPADRFLYIDPGHNSIPSIEFYLGQDNFFIPVKTRDQFTLVFFRQPSTSTSSNSVDEWYIGGP